MFIIASFLIAPKWKQPKYPLADTWINKFWYIHAVKYYSAWNNTIGKHLPLLSCIYKA